MHLFGRFIAISIACAALGLPQGTLAQSWPAKPLRIIVNFPPGGAADVIARAVAPGLGDAPGQQVVIENRPGAGGKIGADAVARPPASRAIKRERAQAGTSGHKRAQLRQQRYGTWQPFSVITFGYKITNHARSAHTH